jgi:hypothetical protein
VATLSTVSSAGGGGDADDQDHHQQRRSSIDQAAALALWTALGKSGLTVIKHGKEAESSDRLPPFFYSWF